MSQRFPGRIAYLLIGLPVTLLVQSLVIWRITPALVKGLPFHGMPLRLDGTEPTQLAVLIGVFAMLVLLAGWLSFARARRLGWALAPIWGLLSCIPLLGIGTSLWLGLRADETEQDGMDPLRLAGRLAVPALVCWLFLFLLALAADVALEKDDGQHTRYLSLTTFILLPLVTAGLAGFLSARAGRSANESLGTALLTLSMVLTALGFAAMEGVICIVMATPFVAVIAIPAAFIGHWFGRRTSRPANQVQCVAWVLVAAAAVGEAMTPEAPLEDIVQSEVVINAPPAKVWAQLKDIRDLPAPKEPLFVMGVAHPLGASVEGEGRVGAHRVCRLSTGDMPEVVTVWKPGEELRFTVLETPATMKEATFFGRQLDAAHLHSTYASLEGGFRLEPLPGGRTRLVGTSRYLLSITPARYWNLWTRDIVASVQLRVMRHVKTRAEAG